MSPPGGLRLYLAKLHKFSNLQMLQIRFHKIKIFHIKSRKFLDYGCCIYSFIK